MYSEIGRNGFDIKSTNMCHTNPIQYPKVNINNDDAKILLSLTLNNKLTFWYFSTNTNTNKQPGISIPKKSCRLNLLDIYLFIKITGDLQDNQHNHRPSLDLSPHRTYLLHSCFEQLCQLHMINPRIEFQPVQQSYDNLASIQRQ